MWQFIYTLKDLQSATRGRGFVKLLSVWYRRPYWLCYYCRFFNYSIIVCNHKDIHQYNYCHLLIILATWPAFHSVSGLLSPVGTHSLPEETLLFSTINHRRALPYNQRKDYTIKYSTTQKLLIGSQTTHQSMVEEAMEEDSVMTHTHYGNDN